MSKIYSILYARSTTGKILEWYVEQLDEQYRVISGQQDGKKIISEWTTARGKNLGRANATTDVEQAVAEIEAMYVKKKKQKYKEQVEDVDIQTYFKPMLAKKYVDYVDKIDFFDGNWIAQLKFNGARMVATKDGVFTRTGERYVTVPHLEKDLITWFEKYPDSVLDGELYSHEHRQQLNELIKLVRKTVHITDEDLTNSEKIVRYYVYDGVFRDGQSYSDRKDFIDNNLLIATQYCASVADIPLSKESDLQDFYNSVLELGEEGIMLRNKNSLYENKRSKNLLKLKPEDDDTCVILNVLEGEGNWSAKCKTFTVEWEGRVFDASLKGSMEDAINIWNNKERWIGRRVAFLYNGFTGLGNPNFARIDCNNCEPST